MNNKIYLAVNGTLMRGLALNQNLLDVGAEFVREDKTDPYYRLWSINDQHPAMLRTTQMATQVALEIWAVPATGLIQVLQQEPAGLTIGKIKLADNSEILGVLGEPWRVENQLEITQFGGWRNYLAHKHTNIK